MLPIPAGVLSVEKGFSVQAKPAINFQPVARPAMPLAPVFARSGASAMVQGLLEGDPVAWGILILVLIFTAVGSYFKFRS